MTTRIFVVEQAPKTGGSMAVQIREIVEMFPELLRVNRGDLNLSVEDIQTGRTAKAHSLIFVSSRQQLVDAEASPAQALVVGEDLVGLVNRPVAVVLSSPNPLLALALIAKHCCPQKKHLQIVHGPKIHPTATIAKTAQIGSDCIIGPGAVIGEECRIGDGCIIGANSVIELGVTIGNNTHIHPLVFIAHGCQIGHRCEIKPNTTIGSEGFGYAHDKSFSHHKLTHYGRVVIEDDVFIGAGVQIDRGTFEDSRIGAGTKVDNHCHLAHNIRIGQKTILTGGVLSAGSVTIGNHCVFGGRSTIKGHIEIGDGCHFAGLSGITGNVTEPGEYGGFPLQPIKDEMRTRASLKQLPNLIKQMRKLLKSQFPNETSP